MKDIEGVLIAGPTAGGKSAIALKIAQEIGGEVINADSMQVYRDLQIITACPDQASRRAVRHHLYNHIDAATAYSVGRWLEDSSQLIANLRRAGRVPVFVGGTGLYFKALTEGISQLPEVDPEIRERWRQAAVDGPHRLHEQLRLRDAAGAENINPSDTQRLVRALEVFDTTGRPLHEWQSLSPPKPAFNSAALVKMVILPERNELRRGIDQRFDQMIDEGALVEVEALLARNLPASMPAMKAIGVRQLGDYLAGRSSLAEATDRAKAASRQYAKRQMTWFRNQTGPDWLVQSVPALPRDLL